MKSDNNLQLLLIILTGFMFIWNGLLNPVQAETLKPHQRFNTDVEFIAFDVKEYIKRFLLPKR